MLLRAIICFIHVSTFKKRSWRSKWDPGLLPIQVFSLLGCSLIHLVFVFLSIDVLIIYTDVKTLMGYVENVKLIHYKDCNVVIPGWGFCFVLAFLSVFFCCFLRMWNACECLLMSSYLKPVL